MSEHLLCVTLGCVIYFNIFLSNKVELRQLHVFTGQRHSLLVFHRTISLSAGLHSHVY